MNRILPVAAAATTVKMGENRNSSTPVSIEFAIEKRDEAQSCDAIA